MKKAKKIMLDKALQFEYIMDRKKEKGPETG
jgi:hypothetical protein